jgi:enoyl-CoA hydratase
MPGYGGTQRLARLIARGVAMELVTTGRILSAQEALALGLVNKVVSAEEFPKAVDEMARLFLKKPAFSLKACMEAVNHGTEMSFEDGLRLESALFAMTCGTERGHECLSREEGGGVQGALIPFEKREAT